MAWETLIAITEEARQLAFERRVGSRCPNDGTALLPGPGGSLFCPFDGWRGDSSSAEPTGPSSWHSGFGLTRFGLDPFGEV